MNITIDYNYKGLQVLAMSWPHDKPGMMYRLFWSMMLQDYESGVVVEELAFQEWDDSDKPAVARTLKSWKKVHK